MLIIDDDICQLLGPDGDFKEDLGLPTDEHLKDVVYKIKMILDEGKKECIVTVLKQGDKEQIVDVREGKDAF